MLFSPASLWSRGFLCEDSSLFKIQISYLCAIKPQKMETVKTIYQGEYRTQATHLLSSQSIITDAPTDNNGKGEAFSPTDLVATALGSCMLTIMDMTANTHGFSLDHITVRTTKIMASNPRRIAEIVMDFDFNKEYPYTSKQKVILENAAKYCPVAKSIHPDIKVVTSFNY